MSSWNKSTVSKLLHSIEEIFQLRSTILFNSNTQKHELSQCFIDTDTFNVVSCSPILGDQEFVNSIAFIFNIGAIFTRICYVHLGVYNFWNELCQTEFMGIYLHLVLSCWTHDRRSSGSMVQEIAACFDLTSAYLFILFYFLYLSSSFYCLSSQVLVRSRENTRFK